MNATPTDGVPVPSRVRVHHLREMKARGEKIVMLTAYDFPTARIFDEAGVDTILVGDSMGNNMLGYDSTLPVTLDELVVATRSVSRAAKRAFVIADLPFGSYEASPQQAHASALRLIKEGGASAVKLEGGRAMTEQVRLLTSSGIPVVGHLGFTPQSENTIGGMRVQGRGHDAEESLVADAKALQDAGACAIVLEMMTAPVAARITEILEIPTIGIGAGAECDGQVLVWTDAVGIGDWRPRFAKAFGNVEEEMFRSARRYSAAVRDGVFPGPEHTYES
ncbi:ketopantoate hydroxymethyltransferase [Ruaniaceae bacterium KH17]|nr:ketopantoate hydroxymethyltransferase [Ruaniaceae bacterium KH17]